MENLLDQLAAYFSLSKTYIKYLSLISVAILAFGFGQLLFYIIRKILKNKSTHAIQLANLKLKGTVCFLLMIVVVNLFLPLAGFQPAAANHLARLFFIGFVLALGMLLIKLSQLGRDYIYLHHSLDVKDNLSNRKVRTQIDFLQKVTAVFIVIVTISVVLMSFTRVREIGTSLIASAGIAGIIIGFAAQKSIANLLAGFQIAFTQPLRLDDVVVVEKEWGKIEEITLTYVVVKIWDERRLVLPISYFIEKPFENWTRQSAEIVGSFFLYLDYSADISALRKEMMHIVASSPFWDKKVAVLQVTDCTEKTLQVRALVSASNASDAWDLKCYMREHLLNYLNMNQPNSLPIIRSKGML